MSTAFTAGERTWQARLGKLRDVVRQEMVARQLEQELPAPPVRVIDLGCGQGTQALRLARRGYEVTGVDASADLLARFGRDLAAEPAEVRGLVRAEQRAADPAAGAARGEEHAVLDRVPVGGLGPPRAGVGEAAHRPVRLGHHERQVLRGPLGEPLPPLVGGRRDLLERRHAGRDVVREDRRDPFGIRGDRRADGRLWFGRHGPIVVDAADMRFLRHERGIHAL